MRTDGHDMRQSQGDYSLINWRWRVTLKGSQDDLRYWGLAWLAQTTLQMELLVFLLWHNWISGVSAAART